MLTIHGKVSREMWGTRERERHLLFSRLMSEGVEICSDNAGEGCSEYTLRFERTPLHPTSIILFLSVHMNELSRLLKQLLLEPGDI